MSRPSHYRSRYTFDLSPRQREVLELIARGRTNAEIADALGISLDGVKWHVRELLGKLGVDSREEAADLWRDSRRPGARVQRLFPAVLAGLSWRVAAAGGVVFAAVVAAIVGYAAFGSGSGSNPSAAIASATSSPLATAAAPASLTPVVHAAPAPTCDPANLSLKSAAPSNGGHALTIDVTFENRGPVCTARGALAVAVVPAAGGFVPSISGNPMQFFVDLEVQGVTGGEPGASGAGIADWSNWCANGRPATISLTFQPGNLSTAIPVGQTPKCEDRGSPSVLWLPVGSGPPPGEGGFQLLHSVSTFASPIPSVSPTPVPAGQPLPYCASSELKLATTIIGGKALMVQLTGFNGDCRIDWPDASFRLMSLVGTALPVDGNGAPIAVKGTSTHLPIGVQIQWENWCGTRTDEILELDTGGARIDTEIPPPACEDKAQPSTVKYVPFAPGIDLPPPTATPLAFAPACDPNKLTPLLSEQGATGNMAVAVQIENAGSVCTYYGDVTMTVEDHGKALDGSPNPGVTQVSVVVPAQGKAPAAVGFWPLQCNDGDSLQVVARLVNAYGTAPATGTIALPTTCERSGPPGAMASVDPGSADPPAGISACDPSELQLRAQVGGAASLAFVSAFITAPHPCWLTGTIRYAVDVPGGTVTGNPADLPVAILLTAGNTNIGSAGWSNWCGSKDAATATVTLLGNPPVKGPRAPGALLTASAKGVPAACNSAAAPSKLQLAPGWEGPSHGELGLPTPANALGTPEALTGD